MKINDLIYNATIQMKDLKVGMSIVVPDDPNNEDSVCRLYKITDVRVLKTIIYFTTRVYEYAKNSCLTIYENEYKFKRTPKEPMITVFFSSLEEALKFGVDRKDIEMS